LEASCKEKDEKITAKWQDLTIMKKFNQFPKVRKPLPAEFQLIYEKEYLINRCGKSLVNQIGLYLEGWMHKLIASSSRIKDEDILEIGAGTLNHIPWEKQYATYDVVEPSRLLIETSDRISAIRKVYQSIADIDGAQMYDRILSIAVLEHLEDLPLDLAQAALLLRQGGIFCAGVPSEGSILWYIAWRFGTGVSFKLRTGLDYSIVMKYEHLNNWFEIEEAVNWFFRDIEIIRVPVSCFHLSLYTIVLAQGVIRERCVDYIDSKLE